MKADKFTQNMVKAVKFGSGDLQGRAVMVRFKQGRFDIDPSSSVYH